MTRRAPSLLALVFLGATGCPKRSGGDETTWRPPRGPAPRCGGLDPGHAARPFSLLAGRLQIHSLRGTRVLQRPTSIMAAPPSHQHETRLYLELRDEKFVIWARELFRQAGGELHRDAYGWATANTGRHAKSFSVSQLTVRDRRLKAVQIVPVGLRTDRPAVLVLEVITRHPDGLVQVISFYVNVRAARSGRACTDLALRLARSLAAGRRRVNRAAGPRRLRNLKGQPALQITLPGEHTVTRQVGPDFTVHRIQRLVAMGRPDHTLGIYVGGHPRHHSARAPGAIQRVRGRTLGRPVTWLEWSAPAVRPGEKNYLGEVIVPLGSGESPPFVHLFYRAPDRAARARLRRVAETLRRR